MTHLTKTRWITLLMACLLWGCAGTGETRPNVIVIVIDTARADHFSAYGYQHTTIGGLPDHVKMSSVGAGFRYQMNRSMTLRGDYGYQLETAPTVLPQPKSRFHVGAVFSY